MFDKRQNRSFPLEQQVMIKKCTRSDFNEIYSVINDAAIAYKGIIPDVCWHEPYFTREYLNQELNRDVEFWGYKEANALIGVMGVQELTDVSLIRHAYVRTAYRKKGIGGKLLAHLKEIAKKPILIGTWADAYWAVNFYEKHGFEMVDSLEETQDLLKKYWTITDIHRENSVVLRQKR